MKIPNQSECSLFLDDERVYLSDSCGPCSACVAFQQLGVDLDINEILSTAISKGWYIPYDSHGVCTSPGGLLSLVEHFLPERKIVGMNVTLNEADAFAFIEKASENYSIIFLTRLECDTKGCSHFVTLSKVEIDEEEDMMIECIDTYSSIDESGEWEVGPGLWKIEFSRFFKVWNSSPDGEDGWLLLIRK